MHIVSFGSLCKLQNGRAFRPSEWSENGTPIVRIQNLNDESKPFNYCNFEVEERFHIQTGDLLFSWSGTPGTSFGAFFWNRGKGFLNQHIFRVDIDESKVDKNYLRYSINSKMEHVIDQAHGGVGLKHITKGRLEAIEIPLPPLPEQKRIADILDKADGIRRKRQQAIDLADEFLRATFLDMFGDPVTNPKRWDIDSVGNVLDCIVPGRDKPKSFTGDTPWVTTNDLVHLNVTTAPKDYKGLTDNEIAEVRAKVVPKGSVLMTCVGDLGVIAIAGNSMVINQQLHAFLPSEKVKSTFSSYALSFQKDYMIKMASNTTLYYMNKTVCNSVPLILPPYELQTRFDKVFRMVSRIKEKGDASIPYSLFDSLSQQAFAGKLKQ